LSNLFILDHNFWTRNARKSLKGSKTLRLEPSFQWKLQRNTLAWWLHPRPGNMSQKDLKTTSLMTSLTKNPHPQPKIFFFECNLEDWLIRFSHLI